jgi:protein-tyrosine-phosphatase
MKVLFVCLGNTCRSPMAEVLFRDLARRRGFEVDVASAGVDAGNFVNEKAAAAVAQYGDIHGRQAKQLTTGDVEASDLILVVEKRDLEDSPLLEVAGRKAFHLNAFAGISCEDTRDPFTGDQATYDACARDLALAVNGILERLSRTRS